ncbi:hypothetical protein [Lysinibacillus xylanilyticus]|uniref:hypothetical protein n=1 Tax=Lysinibacillus xylanilyticus TaxID=582475 RepID=UPI003D0787FE
MQTTINWHTVKPESIYMNNEKLSKLENTIKSDYNNINGIVIIRNGNLAYEKYFYGKSPDDCHHVASVTKSVLSALIGIAIDKGYIKSIEEINCTL